MSTCYKIQLSFYVVTGFELEFKREKRNICFCIKKTQKLNVTKDVNVGDKYIYIFFEKKLH